jgi:hypothetical protein
MTWSRVGQWVPLPQMRDEAVRYEYVFPDDRRQSNGDRLLKRLSERLREIGESVDAIRSNAVQFKGQRWPT